MRLTTRLYGILAEPHKVVRLHTAQSTGLVAPSLDPTGHILCN